MIEDGRVSCERRRLLRRRRRSADASSDRSVAVTVRGCSWHGKLRRCDAAMASVSKGEERGRGLKTYGGAGLSHSNLSSAIPPPRGLPSSWSKACTVACEI